MNYAPQSWLADWSAMTDALTKGENNMPAGVYERKPLTRICEMCGNEYTAFGNKAKYCPECKMRHEFEYYEAYNARRRKGIRPSDVPDVPADDYDTLEEKIRKTAPIETVLVQKKEDNMDTERAERLKTFPSGSNRLEHPEAFTGDVVTPTTTGVDIPNTAIGYVPNPTPVCDTKRRLMDLYGQITSISAETGLAVLDIIDRMNRIDAALN